MTAGACVVCGRSLWRKVTHGLTGTDILLWPEPQSRYLRVEVRPDEVLAGVAVCEPCVPSEGTSITVDMIQGTVVGQERAGDRYRHWYTEPYGAWLNAWLQDEARLDEPAREALLALWRNDRDEVKAP